MMKKRTALRVGILLIFIGICAVYGLFSWKQAEAKSLQAHKSGPVYVTDLGEVSSFSIVYQGNSRTFSLDHGLWYDSQSQEEAGDQASVQKLADLLSKLPAEEMLEQPEDTAAYGLSDPDLSFEITTDQSTATLLIGDDVPDTENCYACLSGGTLVYTIDSQVVKMAEEVG